MVNLEVFVPTLATVGGIMLALLLPAVVTLWQESKDFETAAFFFWLVYRVFLLLDPLVTSPLRLLDQSVTQELANEVMNQWIRTIPSMITLLLLVPVFKLVYQSGIIRRKLLHLMRFLDRTLFEPLARMIGEALSKVFKRRPRHLEPVNESSPSLTILTTALSVGLFWGTHSMLVWFILRRI